MTTTVWLTFVESKPNFWLTCIKKTW